MREVRSYIGAAWRSIVMHREALGLSYALIILVHKFNNFPLHALLPKKLWKAIKSVVMFGAPECWICQTIRLVFLTWFITYMVMR